ncbi:GDSL-type esterase/lipase family protein [Streptomyces sp. NPDC058751]|uniref:GDSL-type esterase/lipase family protein n=1 Tax=Streptomyces sp. NPDC058751 TaxID=3346623 RepID=UPI0036997BAC
MIAAAALPGVAQEAAAADAPGCSAHATSFATAPVAEGTAGLRIGCARDAGGLRELARGDDDLVAAVDFNPGDRPDQLHELMQQLVDTTKKDQANGLSLGDSLTLQTERNSIGYYQQPGDSIDYDGSVQIVGDSLVFVVPAGDIAAAGFADSLWKKFVAGLAAGAAGIAASALCMLILNASAAVLGSVCGAVGGAVAGGVSELLNAFLEGKPIDADVWGSALGSAMAGAAIGGAGGLLLKFVTVGSTSLVLNIQNWLREWASKLGAWGNPLGAVANVLRNGNVAERLREAVQWAVGGGGARNAALRIMPLGDSITYGTGSTSGAGYRSTLYRALDEQSDVEYVGSQWSGPAISPNSHEGHPGWLIGDIAGITDSVVTTYRPNVVLLHIGTNDMNNNVDPDGAPARLGSLIDQILRNDPKVTLLVSTIVPSAFPETNARITRYNAAIPGVVEARRAAGKHVRLVRMNTVSTANLADGLHPDDRGYEKMAAAFYDGLLRAADDGWLAGTGGGDGPVGGPVKGWFPQGTIAGGVGATGSHTRFADINGDGRADYLKVNDDSSVQAWLNGGPNPKEPNGSDWLWFPQGTVAGGVGAAGSHVRFADINGDGRADYLKVNDDSSVQAWLNGGPNPKEPNGSDWLWFPQGTVAGGVGAAGSHVRFADINGDGRADYLKVNDDSSVQAWLNGGPNPKEPAGSDWLWYPQGTIAGGVGATGARVRFAPLYGRRSADYVLLGSDDGVNYDSSARVWQNGGPNPKEPAGHDWLWYPGGTVASGVGVDGARIQFADLNNDGRADYLDVDPQNGATRAWINYG